MNNSRGQLPGSNAERVRPLLSESVAHFNQPATGNLVANDQPPLTDDELIDSLRSLPEEEQHGQLTANDVEQLRSIAEKRSLPAGWGFEVATKVKGVDGDRFRWIIQLTSKRGDGAAAKIKARDS